MPVRKTSSSSGVLASESGGCTPLPSLFACGILSGRPCCAEFWTIPKLLVLVRLLTPALVLGPPTPSPISCEVIEPWPAPSCWYGLNLEPPVVLCFAPILCFCGASIPSDIITAS
ncbi:hypothetical protein NP493_1192g00006 [Ridgeia piscesae]|uniref:Uncharacterized protein n=1 Tax=Ridgeia piscesae TaxID=27915 RepID=A0AAD9KDU0_RIDPI|nr:hypothetical protein NP493_1192g00006 [Ridgeia piscesae]